MRNRQLLWGGLGAALLVGVCAWRCYPDEKSSEKPSRRAPDPAADAAAAPAARGDRTEQAKNAHDRSGVFDPAKAPPSSAALRDQPEQGQLKGFDFSRDPLNAMRPMQTFAEIMKEDVEARPKVMDLQHQLLAQRYDLKPRLDRKATMSRGKPLCVGPTARLPEGGGWDALAKMTPGEIRDKDAFPYKALPHPKHVPGGMVFPKSQIDQFPRLQRFDVDFDLPEEFLPEFPPALFLQSRPELGDVSRGEVVSLANFERLFKDVIPPIELDGLRLLLTPMAQEEFNLTDDRKSPQPTLGVACFDCHVNGHTFGQIELNPDMRPQQRRLRLDTPSLRGLYNQQIHGSKRSIRSVRDFSQFEQPRAAYFNGDHTHASKKGEVILTPEMAVRMERFQVMLDWPPAPKLDLYGRLDPDKADERELRGEKLFFGKAHCAECHPAPFYLDNQMHDLHLERFLKYEPGDGPVKAFTLRGIKDSPPYLHDGRCLTLEDVVEFFNLVQQLKLSGEEKADLVAFLRAL